MYRVYKMDDGKDQDLIKVICKTSLLSIVSILNTFLLFAVFSTGLEKVLHWNIISFLIVISDIYTNALCILLNYQQFDAYYIRLCGVCDRKCVRRCVDNIQVDIESVQTV